MPEERKPSRLWGWLMTGIGSVAMAAGGAVLMYVSPLVGNVLKPDKPVANFGHSTSGLTVTFQNRSTGGYEGWWDFGDGTPLEPFAPNQENVPHTYPRPGSYTAKLTLRNVGGEESERAIAVNVEASLAATPAVETLQVIPLHPDAAAPATFRILGKVKDADYCIWGLGEDRPLEVSPDITGTLDRLVTVKDPGYYTFRLVAVSGKKTAEKAESVFVSVGNPAAAEAMLQVTYDAVRVERQEVPIHLQVKYPPKETASSYPFRIERGIEPGFNLVEARFAKPVTDAPVKNPKVELSADRKKVILSGELVKTGAFSKMAAPPAWVAPLIVTLEKRSAPIKKASDPVMATLNIPGTTLMPIPKLPAGWVLQDRKLALELHDGSKVIFRDGKLPVGTVVQIKSRPVRVTATESAGQIRLEVVDPAATALRPPGP